MGECVLPEGGVQTGGLVRPTDKPTMRAMTAIRMSRAKAMMMYFCRGEEDVGGQHLERSMSVTGLGREGETHPAGLLLVPHGLFGLLLGTADILGCVGDVLLNVVHHLTLETKGNT